MAKRALQIFLIASFMCLASIYTFAQKTIGTEDTLSKPYITAEMITLPTNGNFDSYKLTVKGPNNYFFVTEFSGENVPFIDSFGPSGELLEDGRYVFELQLNKKMSDEALDALQFARATGDMTEVNEMLKAGLIQPDTEPVYGYFTIHQGFFVVPGSSEESMMAKNEGRNPNDKPGDPVGGDDVVVGDVGEVDNDSGIRDQVIADDLIVDGSICVGMDCANGESFGFDTIRLKENNLRIKFDDTSNSGSFPNFDWQLTANDSANGGANKFSIDDITSGKTPFTIEGSAPSNSLYVDDAGNVGLNKNTPVVELHITDGDSPTIRLEQDGSSGFQAQTWDMAGNETNYFVRDVTNGSRLPFKIRPSAPTNSLYVDTDGDLGLKTATPDAALDVDGGSSDAAALVQSSGGVPQFQAKYTGTTADRREMFFLSNFGEPAFRFSNTDPSAADDWSMILLASDQFLISRNGSGVNEFLLSNGGNLTIAGAFTEGSDVNIKENFEEIDPLEVLDRVTDLPISTWNYIHDEDSVRHMGPMAQDFAAAFGLGASNTGITNVDANGVMLAAIKGLNQRMLDKEADLSDKDQTIQELQKQNADMAKRLEDLERLVQAMAKDGN